jgi:hypothetical protein
MGLQVFWVDEVIGYTTQDHRELCQYPWFEPLGYCEGILTNVDNSISHPQNFREFHNPMESEDPS